MKKNKILIISASCALGLSLVGAGVGAVLSQKSSAEVPSDTVLDDSLGDDAIGHRVKLGLDDTASDVTPEIDSVVGVRAVDGTKAGAKDVRVYFRLNTIAKVKSATITRSVATAEGEIVKESLDYNVEYAYSSVTGADQIAWVDTDNSNPVSDVTASPYYLVYTLKNIPEENWLDHVTVQAAISYGDSTPSVTAVYNVFGVLGDLAKGVNIEPITGEEGRYKAYASSEIITEAVVPEHIFGYSGFLASEIGTVVALDGPEGGAFEGCSELVSVELPDTIESFDMSCFEDCSSLTSVTLPRDLVALSNWLLDGCDSLKTIYYQAMNLSNDSNIVFTAGLEVYVAASVESLPVRFFYNADPLVVHFGGTEAEWTALKTTDNNDNGFFIENVICSDTVVHTVTFHIGEGVVNGLTGDYVVSVKSGLTVEELGNASMDGKIFAGWFTDEAGETEWDPTQSVTSDLDVYAIYEDIPAGYSADDPMVLTNETKSLSYEIFPGHETVYFSYTHPSDALAGYHYLAVNEDVSVKNPEYDDGVHSAATYLSPRFKVYKGSVSDENLVSINENEDFLARSVADLISENAVRVYCQPGETYILVAEPYDTTSNYRWYGTFGLEWFTLPNDNPYTAAALTLNQPGTIVSQYYNLYDRAVRNAYSWLKYSETQDRLATIKFDYVSGHKYANSAMVVDLTTGEVVADSDTINLSPSGLVTLQLEANHDYGFGMIFNDASVEYSITVGDVVPGSDARSPIAYTIGTDLEVTPANGRNVYYSFSLEESTSIAVSLAGGSDSEAKYFVIKSAAGDVVGEYEEKGSGSGWSVSYGSSSLTRFALEAGDYLIEVGYTDGDTEAFGFNIAIVQDGDYIGRPKAIDFESGTSFNLTARTDGFFYSFTPKTATNYLKIVLPEVEGLTVELVDAEGATIKTAFSGGSLGFKVETGSVYLLKVSGVEQEVTVTTSFVDTYEDGLARDTALTIDETGIINLDHLCGLDSASYWFKFTPSESGTYVLFSRNPDADTRFEGVYEGDSDVALEYEGNGDDDYNEHPQTQYRFDFAVEVQLEAGKTYYMKARLNTSSAEAMSVGYDLLTLGSTIGMAIESSFLETGGINLTGDDTGTFYSDVAEVAGYYTFPALTDGGASSVVIYVNGTEKATLSEAEVYLKVEAGDVVVAKVIGGAVNLSAVYSETVENGDSAPNAISIASGINDMTIYQTDSIQNPIWFKFTVATSGTYRIYSQSVNGSANSGVDSKINGLWADPADTTSGSSLCEANDDDSNEHDVTIYKWDFYVEVTLEAGVTYYASLKLPIASSIYGLNVVIELLPTA